MKYRLLKIYINILHPSCPIMEVKTGVKMGIGYLGSKLLKISLAVFALSGLLACGGSSGKISAQEKQLTDLTIRRENLFRKFQPIVFTNLADVPTTGSASYNGYLTGFLSNTPANLPNSLSGNVHLQVSFGSDFAISGTAENFLDDMGFPLAGSIILSDGQLNRLGNPTVDATLSFRGDGSLENRYSKQIEVSSVFQGDFIGITGEGIGGDVLGRVTSEGTDFRLAGVFVVEKSE